MTKALPIRLLVALLMTVSGSAEVRATDLVRTRQPADACARTDMLITIVKRYAAHAPASSPRAIVEIRDMHLRRTQRQDRLHRVGRDYCGGTALTSDGVVRPIWYLIERDFAFAALGSGVEFCLRGLDRTYVYGADCASLK